MKPRINLQFSAEMEAAIAEFQAEVKTIGAEFSRSKAFLSFAELGRKCWCEEKQAASKSK
jgi:hypothetical protein